MEQQRQRVDRHRQPLRRGQGRVLCEAIGVGDPHPLGDRHGLPAQPQPEVLQRDRRPSAVEASRSISGRNQSQSQTAASTPMTTTRPPSTKGQRRLRSWRARSGFRSSLGSAMEFSPGVTLQICRWVEADDFSLELS